MASSSVRMKLLIDTKARKVLFAEAGKDFVDFLLHLLSLPLGTVVKLLKEKGMVGSLNILYGSIETLNETYFEKNESKHSVLNYVSPLKNVTGIPLLLSGPQSAGRNFYTCTNYNCHKQSGRGGNCYMTDVENLNCPGCSLKLTKLCYYVSPTAAASTGGTVAEGGGFVKGVVTYMIMDNLEVMPMSTISSITLLNKFNVKDVGGLEEKIVDIGLDEGLMLLKVSLECNTVLTKVFLGKKA